MNRFKKIYKTEFYKIVFTKNKKGQFFFLGKMVDGEQCLVKLGNISHSLKIIRHSELPTKKHPTYIREYTDMLWKLTSREFLLNNVYHEIAQEEIQEKYKKLLEEYNLIKEERNQLKNKLENKLKIIQILREEVNENSDLENENFELKEECKSWC